MFDRWHAYYSCKHCNELEFEKINTEYHWPHHCPRCNTLTYPYMDVSIIYHSQKIYTVIQKNR